MIFRTVPTDPDHDQDAEDDLFYRDTLQEMVHVGATLARLLQTQAIADAQAAVQGRAPATPLGDHAATFDRIARAVRRTITLARSLREPAAPARIPAPPSAAARTPALHGAGQDAAGHPAATGREDAEAPNKAPSADLRDCPEARDRDRPERPDRDAPDCDDDDTGLPPAAVIADIRRDLGLDAPPGVRPQQHRTPADTGQPCAQAAASSSVAASAARQPGPMPQSPGPQSPGPRDLRPSAAKPCPGPEPGYGEPGGPDQPAAIPRVQPGPIHAGSNPLDDPARTVAFVPHHPVHIQERWRPPGG